MSLYFCCNVNWFTFDDEVGHSYLLNVAGVKEVQVKDRLPETARLFKRTSRLSRLVVNHVLWCHPDCNPDYAIFTSRFGELEFIDKNIEMNTIGEELSPTIFSHSVHNAIACLYSVAKSTMIPTVSISQKSNAITQAFIEAVTYLKCHAESKKVLVVVYDGLMPERYARVYPDSKYRFLLSFEVCEGSDGFEMQAIVDQCHEKADVQEEITRLMLFNINNEGR